MGGTEPPSFTSLEGKDQTPHTEGGLLRSGALCPVLGRGALLSLWPRAKSGSSLQFARG